MGIRTSSVAPTNGALIIEYPEGQNRVFTFQPVRGYHADCYRELAKRRIKPVGGLDLALIVAGCFTENLDWQRVRKQSLAWGSGGIRMPYSILVSKVLGQEGFLIQKDIEGLGTSREISVPDSPSESTGWKIENGVYKNEALGQVWIPGVYSDGPIKEDDKLARGFLTDEGAEINYRTAVDNHLTPYRWMPSVETGKAVKRVGLLHERSDRLYLYCLYYLDCSNSSAFGCVDAEGVAKNKENS